MQKWVAIFLGVQVGSFHFGTQNLAEHPGRVRVTAIKAAVLIQSWYRCYKARLELRRRHALTIFESIEYADEQDQLQLANFFTFMLENYTQKKEESMLYQSIASIESQRLDTKTVLRMVEVPDSYEGPRLIFPLTYTDVLLLINAFKENQILHARYVLEVLVEAKKVLKQLPNITHIMSIEAKELTICGDIHGKLDDLFLIFYKNGLPSGNNRYVFNGDFVDRGENSMEVLMVLFALFLVFPNDVYLNRGNHEDFLMNLRYGFTKEITSKYKIESKKRKKQNAVKLQRPNLAQRRAEKRHFPLFLEKMRSVLMPPSTPSEVELRNIQFSQNIQSSSLSLDQMSKNDWDQIINLLWSDPRNKKGCFPNTSRGGGCYFGPDITNQILNKFALKMIIRSHECKPNGFEICHDGKVITLFSASNYYEEGSNRGAYLKLKKDLIPRFFQYQCHQMVQSKTLHESVDIVENTAFRILGEKLIARSSDLMEAFKKYDVKNSGKITLSEWGKAVSEVLEMDLPWLSLCPRLAQGIENGYVLYRMGFKKLLAINAPKEVKSGMFQTLVRYRSDLKTIFNVIDKDKSGLISLQEFRDIWKLFCSHYDIKSDEAYVDQLANTMDLNHDGFIDFNEFLTAFDVVHNKLGGERRLK
ncbi:serine/threonine-protein phosphatase with EF-hands 1 [Gracilinanus agilis]|uniref:serine/threonine-protein phosphatase with EF-hands 1 n=1 Tax=Gracilinanus agilis TaxID=191870 RepID=UPI001CFE39BC|nr:serine/threonine-protein phosphatase with EF-hands 1 [Gracilinanus agilis]